MPFNDKGEFIRSEPRPAQRSTRSRSASDQFHIVPPGRARVTSSANRPQLQRPSGNRSRSDLWKVVGGILAILLGLAALAGVIWLVVTFREWILFGLALWLISAIRSLFD